MSDESQLNDDCSCGEEHEEIPQHIKDELYEKGILDDPERLYDEKYHVELAMLKFGGSFVSGLGEALSHADPNNVRRIKNSFPEYWKKYLEMGRKEVPVEGPVILGENITQKPIFYEDIEKIECPKCKLVPVVGIYYDKQGAPVLSGPCACPGRTWAFYPHIVIAKCLDGESI